MSKGSSVEWEERVSLVRRHFEGKGYRVHSGLQFGCELVLYADDPSKVHSDFCVHVVPEGVYFARWRSLGFVFGRREVQLNALILLTFPIVASSQSNNKPNACLLVDGSIDWRAMQTLVRSMPDLHKTLILANLRWNEERDWKVDELAMATEHAPFRHKRKTLGETAVGSQRKRAATVEKTAEDSREENDKD